MDAAYPPFGFQNSKAGTYVGFDVDVIRAIGKAEALPWISAIWLLTD